LSELRSQNFFRLNNPSSIYFTANGGTSFGYNAGIPAFSLGGTQRLLAYGTNELLTNQYFLFQLGYIRQLLKLPPLLGNTLDFIGMYEVGKTYQLPIGPKPPNLPNDVVGGLVVNTIFGPVEVGGAVGNYGRARFFFRVGRIF
jgi:NTE family protein